MEGLAMSDFGAWVGRRNGSARHSKSFSAAKLHLFFYMEPKLLRENRGHFQRFQRYSGGVPTMGSIPANDGQRFSGWEGRLESFFRMGTFAGGWGSVVGMGHQRIRGGLFGTFGLFGVLCVKMLWNLFCLEKRSNFCVTNAIIFMVVQIRVEKWPFFLYVLNNQLRYHP